VVDTTCACCVQVPETGFVQLSSHPEIAICYWCLDGRQRQRQRQLSGNPGGWHVVGDEPIFKVSDVARALGHSTKLDFEVCVHDEAYAFADRDDRVTIHLTHDDGDGLGPSALYLHVDGAAAVGHAWRAWPASTPRARWWRTTARSRAPARTPTAT
jgi:hypothetical protein